MHSSINVKCEQELLIDVDEQNHDQNVKKERKIIEKSKKIEMKYERKPKKIKPTPVTAASSIGKTKPKVLASMSAEQFENMQAEANRPSPKRPLPKPYVCLKCSREYVHEAIFLRHKCIMKPKFIAKSVVVLDGEKYDCKSSSSKFLAKPSVVAVFDDKKYDCEWCTETYSTVAALQSHTLLIHSKPFACQSCPKSFSNYYFYQIHTTIHNDLDHPRCNVCSRNFSTILRLRQHMLTHLHKKPHVCNLCSKGFMHSCDLTYHQELCRPFQIERFSCKLCCNESFTEPVLLAAHYESHCHNDNPGSNTYICSLCLQSFRYSFYFIRHMLVHSGLKSYICDICRKGFATKKAIRRHMSEHFTF